MGANMSRPLLLAAVGPAAQSGGQTTLYLTPLRGVANVLGQLGARIGQGLQSVKAAAEQFKTADRWALMLAYASDQIIRTLASLGPNPPCR